MFQKPMLAQIVDKPFYDQRYLWEVKFDGARCIAVINGNQRLYSRSGREMTNSFPEIQIDTKLNCILDGELVCYDQNGKPLFNYIQHRTTRENGVQHAVSAYPATFEVFDILYADGHDLKALPLIERKDVLAKVLNPRGNIRLVPAFDDGELLYAQMEQLGWEGVVGKLKNGRYEPGKRRWFKKRVPQQDWFYVVGFTQGTGWRTSTFGSLVLASLENNQWKYVGSVGTGFNEAQIRDVDYRIKSLPIIKCPFKKTPIVATWIKPDIKVLVEYAEITNDGRLRFPSWKGMI